MLHYVYIIQSLSDPAEYYTGLTSDPQARLADHKAGKSSHTSKHRPWKLIHHCWFEDPAKAAEYEQYLKSGIGRAFAAKQLR
jgi:putative endonuclease